MDENPYEPPQAPDEENRRRTFLAISAPLVLPAVAIAFCTMCTMNGAVQSSSMGSVQWVVSLVAFLIPGVVFVVSLVYLADRWLRP